MNPMRDELPDIDIDVESARREDVYDMILSRHGDDRAACVAMIDTYRARSADPRGGQGARPARRRGRGSWRRRSRTSRRATCARRSSACPSSRASTCRCAQLELLFRVAERLDGFPRHIALHPCGIVLAEPRPGGPRAARAQRERPPDDPGRQGRRRAARLPEARHPGRADALVDAPRAGRDRAHHRREGRPRPDRARRRRRRSS